ncbi:hypothetical protein BMS3Abin17_01075 [archaeon BMS3Abin17]|nr:hypothetical protein BMS3Abin17_01075 [archaeon BMS3Abin17]HDZ61271.1 DUF262 domain-containing protein [Candidatus Pacearchaeota archaeon]
MVETYISVRELVDKVLRKELKLPEMQRKYIWPGTRVRDLLDSLYRKYPSGTILVWETDEDIQERDLAIKSTKPPTTSQKWLLLDGQQRITSLSAIISGEPVHVRKRKRPIEILFNLEHPEGPPVEVTEVDENDGQESSENLENGDSSERDIWEELKKKIFVVSSKTLKNNPLWIPVSDVFKKSESQILKSIGINSDDEKWDKYSARLQNLKKIADYTYGMQVLDKNKSYEEVTEIFVRVNSLGIKLRGSDLALAQITSKWKGFMDQIEEFAKEFKEDEDYILESGLPVRTLVVFATQQSKFKTVGKIKKKKLEESWELAKNGLRFAVNFLRSNAGVDNLSNISSPFLLIPIAIYAMNNNEKLSGEDEKRLLRWFYLAHMRGHYGMGSSESILDLDISIIFRGNSVDNLLNQLQTHVKKFEVGEKDIFEKGIRSPFFSMLYFVLKQNEAKDWWTGLSLSERHIGRAHSLQYHHIFPKSLLKKAGFEKKEVNEISNLAFIGGKTNRQIAKKEPKIYLKEIIEKRGKDTLASQLISLEKEDWEINNYKKFLEFRRKRIAEEINKFMRRFE